VSDQHTEYARKLESELKTSNIRVKVDDRTERMNQKIRQAQMDKVPCMLIVGEKEAAAGTVSVRLRTGEQMNNESLEQFKEKLLKAIAGKMRDIQIG
jgi:threonyl-tRNA synthetase